MPVTTMTRLFGLLALAALGLALAAGPLRGRMTARHPDLLAALQHNAWGVAFAVATVATAGSLYLSEIAGFPPCRLCWVQRAFMYPLVPILGLLAVGGLRRPARFVPWWAGAGALVSILHLAQQRVPALSDGLGVCAADNPCSVAWVTEFGFLTIPGMALCGFLAIGALSRLAAVTDGHGDPAPNHSPTGALA